MCDILISDSKISDFISQGLSSSKTEKIGIVLVGGPGSGKSIGKIKAIESLAKFPKDFVNIDPDEILTSFFNNNNVCRKQVNDINEKYYKKAIEQHKNIIFDGTGKDYDWYSKNVLKKLKKAGYTVYLIIVMNDVNVVLERIQKRASADGRDVPEDYTRSVYDSLSIAIPKYLSLDCEYADYIYLYDNSKDSIHIIYKTGCIRGVKEIIMSDGNSQTSKNKKSRRKIFRKIRRKSTRKIRKKSRRNSRRKNVKNIV